jgi:hypothetical protein
MEFEEYIKLNIPCHNPAAWLNLMTDINCTIITSINLFDANLTGSARCIMRMLILDIRSRRAAELLNYLNKLENFLSRFSDTPELLANFEDFIQQAIPDIQSAKNDVKETMYML